MLEYSRIAVGGQDRRGELVMVSGAHGLVVFAHANGNSQNSRRSLELARRIQQRHIGTLVFDLLTPREAEDITQVFDILPLAQRLEQAIDALPATCLDMPIGLFGSSTGTAAALVVAARRPQNISALVSRGGRPDLAGEALRSVRAATLLIVGAADAEVRELNRWADQQLECEKRIEIVPRATHLFLEAGALDAVAERAGEWFATHLKPRA